MSPTRSYLHAAFFLSGCSGLVYEVLWARALATLVGATAPAAQAVLAAFFVGLALGGATLGRRAAKAADGARAYARLELALAAAGLYSAVALAAVRGPVAAITDGADGARTAALALGVALLCCGPAALLMGATLAAVVRALEGEPGVSARAALGRAYAANTAGAVVGAIGTAFVALPALGMRGSYACAALVNLGAAALAWRARAPAPLRVETPAPRMPAWIAAALALSGFAAITLQVLAVRVVAVTLQDTVYTFALAIAAYILGAAATSAVFARMRRVRVEQALPFTLAAATLAAAAWLPLLRLGLPMYRGLFDPFGGFARTAAVEAAVALVLTAPAAIPTTWAFLALAAHPRAGGAAAGSSRATAWNGLGCALAPIVSALFVLPRFRTFGLAAVGVSALAAAALVTLAAAGSSKRRQAAGLLVAAALALVAVRGGLFEWVVAPGWKVVWGRESAAGLVSIEESPEGLRRLRTNNNFTEGGDGAMIGQARQGLLAALFVPDARRTLVLGVGSGGTLVGAWAGQPAARIDAVELVPEIREALGFFSRSNGRVGDRPHITLHVADARTFAAHAAARGTRYDLVVGDLFHAGQAGTGALYAREHFAAVRRALAPGGAYCQWVPLHEAPLRETRAIVRAFFAVFPHGAAVLGSPSARTPILGLVGSEAPVVLDAQAVAARVAAPKLRAAWSQAADVHRVPVTLAAVLGPAEALRAWAGAGPQVTDDRPALELGAPRGRHPFTGLENLEALVDAPLWYPPDALVRYGEAATRERVRAIRDAVAAHVRAHAALRVRNPAAAESELRRAFATAPDLDVLRDDAAELADVWTRSGRPERAAAVRALVPERR